jgi:hypothetical protein
MRRGDGPAVPAARQAQASGVLFGAIFVLCLNCGLLESRVWHVKLFGGKTEGMTNRYSSGEWPVSG